MACCGSTGVALASRAVNDPEARPEPAAQSGDDAAAASSPKGPASPADASSRGRKPGISSTSRGKKEKAKPAAVTPTEEGPAKVPIEELPKDAYVVALPTFEGPLDLLLHLIQKHELDILDIPVSFITEKYLLYLNLMKELTIDVASEYLVMAATLTHIKSKMLLPDVPKDQGDGAEEEEEDPRAELVRRLLEYQKYKAAAEDLGKLDALGKDVFPRGAAEPIEEGPAPFAPFGVFDLLTAFSKILEKTKGKVEHEVVFDRISITDRIMELTEVLKARRSVPFEELFGAPSAPSEPAAEPRKPNRFDVVITFLAVLEMCRLKMMRVYQAEALSPIHVELLVVDEDDALAAEEPFIEPASSAVEPRPFAASPGDEAAAEGAEAMEVETANEEAIADPDRVAAPVADEAANAEAANAEVDEEAGADEISDADVSRRADEGTMSTETDGEG